MSESNDNNFRDLKRLLKLKQHEVPPPGYFGHFSGDVISRIRAGEAGGQRGFFEYLQVHWPRLAGVLHLFALRPALIGGLATCSCLLLLVGVVLGDRPDGVAESGSLAQTASPNDVNGSLASVQLAPAGDSGIALTTNPVTSLQPVATMFGSQQNPLFQPVGFVPAQ